MIAPYEKLKKGGNDTIQIVASTSCDIFTCSNCTQLLPYRTDYRHMTLSCVEKALKSLVDWPGVVGLFGGNPCVHPEFEAICLLMEKLIHPQSRRGLWSNHLMGHGSLIRRVFYPDGRFNLNVHCDVEAAKEMGDWVPGRVIHSSVREKAWHAPILMSHKDLGVSEADWVTAREDCDINQKWSAAIVEREGKPYAYFCEVAAALDGIKGTNHGVPLHYQWWQATMAQFQGQVTGCCDQGCGVPLRYKGHQDSDSVYDITEAFIPYTTLSKAVTREVHRKPPKDHAIEATDYMRLRTTNV